MLLDQVVAAQRAVEQRLANWSNDMSKLQEGLSDELKRVEARQRATRTAREVQAPFEGASRIGPGGRLLGAAGRA